MEIGKGILAAFGRKFKQYNARRSSVTACVTNCVVHAFSIEISVGRFPFPICEKGPFHFSQLYHMSETYTFPRRLSRAQKIWSRYICAKRALVSVEIENIR